MANPITLPAFTAGEFSSEDMRQLVSALELRFQALELDESSIFATSDELDGRFSPIGHTHTESEITDLQSYLTSLNAESIFSLLDVSGSPSQDDVLIWNDNLNTFVAGPPGSGSFALSDLSDVSVPDPGDNEVLTYDSNEGGWVSAPPASTTSPAPTFTSLLDTDLLGADPLSTSQALYDMVYFAPGLGADPGAQEWWNTAGDLQWNPIDDYLQLALAHSINWLGVDNLSKELLILEGEALDEIIPDLDDEVVLLMHFDDVDGSRTYEDSSSHENHGWSTGQSVTFAGNSQLKTNQSKFGGTSYYQDRNIGANHIRIKPNDSMVFGTNDFTVEFWYRPENTGVDERMISNIRSSNGTFRIGNHNSLNIFIVLQDGTTTVDYGPVYWPHGNTDNVWGHHAMVRDGDLMRYFKDGVEQTPTASAVMPTDYEILAVTETFAWRIGDDNGDTNVNPFASEGWFDEVRFTNGTAVYTSNFTVETSPFPDPVMPTGDPYFDNVTLLLNFNDNDGATSTTNEGSGTNPTFSGGAIIQDVRSASGVTSLRTEVASDGVLVYDTGNDGIDDFGSDDFTIEFWFANFSSGGSAQAISRWVTGDLSESSYKLVNTGGFTWYFTDGTDEWTTSALSHAGNLHAFSNHRWTHIAFVRDGDDAYIYVDGTELSTQSGSGAWVRTAGPTTTQPPPGWSMPYEAGGNAKGVLGGQWVFGSSDYTAFSEAWTDGVRITKGVCRYPGAISFKPPLTELPTFQRPAVGASDLFIVGDPAINTQIDGLITEVTSETLQLLNENSINWLDGDGTSQELLVLSLDSEAVGVGHLIANFEGVNGARTYIGEGPRTWIFQGDNADNEISTVAFKFGSSSYEVGTTGSPSTDGIYTNLQSENADFFIGTRDFYVRFWFRTTDSQTGGNWLFGLGAYTGGDDDVEIHIANGVFQVAYASNNSAKNRFPFFGGAINDSQFHEVVVERVGDNLYVYQDGVQSGSTHGIDAGATIGVLNQSGDRVFIIGAQVDTSGVFSGTPAGTAYIDAVEMKIGVNLNGGVAPGAPSTEAPEVVGAFTVGDPDIPTIIEGESTTITSALTSIDGTLDVGGATVLADTLDVIGVTTLDVLDVTGAATLSDTLDVVGLSSLHDVTIFDATDVASAAWSITLTEFNLDLSPPNTDWNITGLDTLLFESGASMSWLIPSAVELLAIEEADAPLSVPTDPYYGNVVLLLDLDGDDAATAAPDLSSSAHQPLTFVADAQIDTAQSKFGGSSLVLDGTGDYVSIPHSDDWDLAAEDFTIEFHVRFNGDPGTGDHQFIAQWQTTGNETAWSVSFTNNIMRFAYSTNGTDTVLVDEAWNPAGDTWYHLAYVRTGGFFYHFVDGVQLGSEVAISNTIFDSDQPLLLGVITAPTTIQFLNGWLDNVRITKGFGRYTANFTPPTEQYPQHDSDFLNVSLLANFDGDDADTSYISEDYGLSVATFFDNAQLDTAQSMFGVSSLMLDGTDDYVTFPDSPDFDFGSGDFTVECRVRFNGDPGTATAVLIDKYQADGVNNRSWHMSLDNNLLRWIISTNGTDVVSYTTAWNPVGEQWYDVAITREGTSLKFFVDGALLSTQTSSETYFSSVSEVFIGVTEGTSGLDGYLNGWLDNVRITKGIARYTAAFEPSTRPQPSQATEDPYWDSVTLLANFDGADAATNYVSEDEGLRVATFGGNAELDTAQSVFGGSSVNFDGSANTILTFPDSTDFEFGTGDFTVELWVRFDGAPDGNGNIAFIAKWDTAGANRAWTFWWDDSTNTLNFNWSSTGSNSLNVNGGWSSLTDATWFHLAATFDGTTIRLFVDGSEVGSSVTGVDISTSSTTPLDIGATLQSGTVLSILDGWIDEARITKGVARYTAEFTPATRASPVPVVTVDPDWDNVALLANFDGADADTSYTSEDVAEQVAAFFGTAQLDDAQSVFGGTAINFDGTGDYITFPHSDDYDLAAGDFTIEFRVRWSSDPGTGVEWILGHYDAQSTDRGWAVGVDDERLRFIYSTNGTDVVSHFFNHNPAVDTWYSYALSRNADVLYGFVDGALITSSALTATINDSASTMDVASLIQGSGRDTAEDFTGWIDELRITKGVGRYTTEYDIASRAFPRGELGGGGGGDATFIAGDPAIDMRIDGLTTSITSDATDIAGTLDVVGAVTAPTFNAVALTDAGVDTNFLDETGNYSAITTGVVFTDIDTATPPTTEAVTGFFEILDNEGVDQLAQIGFTDASNDLFIRNHMEGGGIQMRAVDVGGSTRFILDADPDDETRLFGDTVVSLQVGGSLALRGIAGGITAFYHAGSQVSSTDTAADGGLVVINNWSHGSTGVSQRALTVADSEAGQPRLAYQFATSVTASDPGAGNVRFDNATLALVTEIYIADLSDVFFGAFSDSARILDNLSTGDVLTIGQVDNDPGAYVALKVSGVLTDNTDWWTIPVTFLFGGANRPANQAPVIIDVQWLSKSQKTPWTSDIDGAGFGLDNIDRLEIQEPGGPSATATFTHDGTNFNTTFSNTTSWDIAAIVGFSVVNYSFNVSQTVGAGQDNFVLTYDDSSGVISLEVASIVSIEGNFEIFRGSTARAQLQFRADAAPVDEANFLIYQNGGGLRFATSTDAVPETPAVDWMTVYRSGTAVSEIEIRAPFAIHQTSGADNVSFDHDGTDFNMVGTNTADWNISGITAIQYGGIVAVDLQLQDYSLTHHVETSSSGTLTLDMSLGNSMVHTLGEDITTVTITNPPASGLHGEIFLKLIQDPTTPRTVTWDALFHFPGGTDHVMSATIDQEDRLHLQTTDGGTTYDVTFWNNFG